MVGGAVEAEGGTPVRGAADLGGHADVLFGRDRGSDMAVGPYAEVTTLGFRDADIAGGAEWLVPLRDDLPIVLSAGALLRNGQGRSWSPGADAAAFFGSRSYNFHSFYGMATGLFAEARWLPVAPSALDVVVGVQIDAELLALPALLVWGLFR
jgi:hypothetical protein